MPFDPNLYRDSLARTESRKVKRQALISLPSAPLTRSQLENYQKNPSANSSDEQAGYILGGATGGAIGLAFGNPAAGAATGAQVGSFIGRHARNIFNIAKEGLRLAGMGDYTLKSNSLLDTGGATESTVQIIPQGNRAVRLIYKEYIGDVFTHPTVAGAFNLASYPINPGLPSTFPWLAPIAQQYEQWTPNGIVFEFRSTSSEYTATQALGSVIMATEYDTLDSLYSNKQEMLNSCYSNEAKPSQRILHGLECDPRDNPMHIYYVRAGGIPTNASSRDYDLATFQIATQGGATTNLNLGSLYVHYDITFRKEQLFNGLLAKGILHDLVFGVGGVASATPLPSLANTANVRNSNDLQLFDVGGLGTTIVFKPFITTGIWRVEWCYLSAAAGATTAPTLTGTTNCTAVANYRLDNGVVSADLPGRFFNSAAGEAQSYVFKDFLVTGAGAVVTASAATLAGGNLTCWVSVRQMGTGW